jgi:RNA polymerase sporulation-specific sigma factor|nr:MAG TPA: DNA directed RNA polymerase subunit [Caudoviricetes sp.]
MDIEKKNQLAEENLALVHWIVNKRFKHKNITKEERDNYIGEGMYGLARAINTFDESKGYKFSTYAYKLINGDIRAYIEKQNRLKRKIDIECKASIDNDIPRCEELKYSDWIYDVRDDYKTISEVDYILYILEKTNIKDIKTIIIKRAEGYENREIAEIINVNKNTIKTRLRRLKERLLELGITA